MPVPLLDVNAQNYPLEAEFTAAFQRVFRNGHFIMGEEIMAFERAVRPLTGAEHAIGVSSGTDAILLALMALGIGPGDEVLCPAFTFFATAGCVSRVGATPVFTDVAPGSFSMSVEAARAKITPATKAVIPVHLFGQSADMDALLALAEEHGLHVIEDAAQAIGAEYRQRKVGSMGAFGCFSFFPSKNLGGLGDGGLIVTNDDALADRARALRNHGMQPKYHHSMIGGNFRLDALQAAFLRVKLPHLEAYNTRRRANAASYTERLRTLPGVWAADAGPAPSDASLILPATGTHVTHIWNQYTLRVPGEGRRDALLAHLTDRKIGCEIYYPLTLDQQECFAHLPRHARSDCTISRRLAAEVLSIPVYPELPEAGLDEVVAAITAFVTA